ncbi:MAG: beta-ketoacyl-ACP synthase [Desulfobulbaceae bacterium]|nr:beta-ketoacyl-ACP synthase [Desulfobulbaceae bacterium]
MSYYLADLGIINALGAGKPAVLESLLRGDQSNMRQCGPMLTGRYGIVAVVSDPLLNVPPELQAFDCRNNKLLVTAAEQIRACIEAARVKFGSERIAVILGTSTSGITAAEAASDSMARAGVLPAGYNYQQQEMGTAAEFLARYLQLDGPRYTISTACSSSARAIVSGERLLAADLCDAVVVGGCDSICSLTTNGFDALGSMSGQICNPFSVNRKGINVGEGAALFLMTRDEAAIRVAGAGESSDAYHMSAPEPSGKGAELAIRQALSSANAEPGDIGYINLHGTATPKNDEMESCVVNRIFGREIPCSSTKSQIGHTLGAAGAQEIGLCWLLLDDSNPEKRLPRHLWDGEVDPAIETIGLTAANACWNHDLFMSNSFAFGGSNASVIIGRS